MVELTHIIKDPMGFHARLVALVAAEAQRWESVITVAHGNLSAPADNVMALMGLGAHQGDELVVTIEGSDEQDASEFMAHLMRSF